MPQVLPPAGAPNDPPRRDARLAAFLYRSRFWLSALVLAAIAALALSGALRIQRFSTAVASLADTSIGDGAVKPLAFNPTMDIWFGEDDAAVQTFRDIENTFVAEDYVMVTFRVPDRKLGVFDRESLATIARLTARCLTIPGVRHVRSLTYNPWIRWGTITDDTGSEPGLIISDLVEGDPQKLTDAQILERMIAVLGATRTADRVGVERVQRALGPDADFGDHPGEPLLLGTILDETGTTTAIQVQVLRPHMAGEVLDQTFTDAIDRQLGPALSSIEQQRAALRGIEHFVRLERGLAVPTPAYARLKSWIEGLPLGEERTRLTAALADPTKNFLADRDGVLQRKFFEYDLDGTFVDRSAPSQPVTAPPGFQPQALSPFEFHIGGVPLFERNFEVVGLADARFVPLMFLVIALVLGLVFRTVSGVVVPLLVVFGSIIAMVGGSFVVGSLLNNLTMMAPNMLTAVGIADAIHLVAAWLLLRGQFDDRHALITEVIRRNAMPVFLTSITTAVGFYSLTTSAIEPVQGLGATASFGTFFAWALSMTLIPAVLSLLPHRQGSPRPPRLGRVFSTARVGSFVDRVTRWRRGILIAFGLLLVVATVGILRMTIDSDFRRMFPDDNPTITDFNWIEKHLGGVGNLEMVFYGLPADATQPDAKQTERLEELRLRQLGHAENPQEFAALTPEERENLDELEAMQARWQRNRIGVSPTFLSRLEAFEARLRAEMATPGSPLTVLSDILSPLDTLRKINQVQNRGAVEFYRPPTDADVPATQRQPKLAFDEITESYRLTPAQSASNLIAQYYLQYESGARPGESLAMQLSADRTRFRMQARVLQASSMDHLRAFRRIEDIAVQEFPDLAHSMHLAAHPAATGEERALSDLLLSGKSLLFARTSDLFAHGFMQSMGLALLIITILIGLIYRSVRFALISLIPNVLPILLPLSVLGLLGIPVDGPAVLVASVALGVCVDDTIHFFTKFARGRSAGQEPREALIATLSEAGAAMSVTTVVLIIGFSTLLLSDFAPNFQMGVLASLMIGLAWVADFVVTTAVLSYSAASATADSP